MFEESEESFAQRRKDAKKARKDFEQLFFLNGFLCAFAGEVRNLL
jgi:hypothetical protein